MKDKKVLTLRCCKHDFEEIVKNWQKFRYLEVKKYWESRVLEKNWDFKEFDLINLKNWYSSESPEAIIKFVSNNWIINKEWINYFEIELGEIVGVNNYKKENN